MGTAVLGNYVWRPPRLPGSRVNVRGDVTKRGLVGLVEHGFQNQMVNKKARYPCDCFVGSKNVIFNQISPLLKKISLLLK